MLGGIYSGMFTPTEAAAMSAVYAFVIAVFVYKDMKLGDVPRVLLGSANMSAMILYIITNAVLFSFLMTSEQIPQAMTSWIIERGIGWIEFLLLVNILLLLAGNVMEPSSIVLITAPILFPIAVELGIHPVHLGILMTVNMEIGLCHPPVGLNLYVASGIAKMGITELTIAVWPWLLTDAGVPGDRHLRAGVVAVAAAHARDAVAAGCVTPPQPCHRGRCRPARARAGFSRFPERLGFTSGGRTTAEGMRPRMTSASFMRLCMSTNGPA